LIVDSKEGVIVLNLYIREQTPSLPTTLEALDQKFDLTRDVAANFPRTAWRQVAETGLFREPVNAAVSNEKRIVGTMHALERLGDVCSDAGLNFSIATHIASTITPLFQFGSAELKDRYLGSLIEGNLIGAHAISEPEAGSDALAMTTYAVPEGDTYVLNGSKAFVTNGPIADLIVVYAKTTNGSSPGSVSAFLVPSTTLGMRIGAPMEKVGLISSPLSSLVLENVRVPASNRIGREGSGFLVLSSVMKREILYSFIITVGEMGRRLRQSIQYVNERRQFGANIGAFQSVSNRVAEMKIRYELSRSFLYATAEKMAANIDVTSDIAIAKIFVSEAVLSTAIDALHINGGRGFLAENGHGEAVCNALAGPIYSGTNDIQRTRIATMIGVNV
jgi:alkylation response protein AidB-like acyl-CoA dehydrogenase